MQITDGAKEIIKNGLEEEQKNGVRLHTTRSCCGKSLQIELVEVKENEAADIINEIPVLMDEDTRKWTETVIVDSDGKNLKLINTAEDDNSCCC